jgi:hypothetical protein
LISVTKQHIKIKIIEVYKVSIGKPKGKKLLERPRCRWQDGIRVDLGETGWGVWNGFSWLRIGTHDGLL